jgi:hypothetical protein
MKHLTKMVLILTIATALTFISVNTALADTTSTQLDVKGTISAINKTATPLTVTITPKEGAPITLKIEASTIIKKAGVDKATLDNLGNGDNVIATYSKETLVANRISASKTKVAAQTSVSQPKAKYAAFEGTIKSMTSASFVVSTKKSGDVTINVNPETKYKVPTVKNATLANFKAGNRVAVLATEVAAGKLAVHVNLIPGKPVSVQRVGTVAAYEASKSITLKDKKGSLSVFVVTSDTKIQLKRGATEVKIGEQAHVLARRDPASDQFTAKAILVFGAKGSQKPEKTEKPEKPEKPQKGK